MDNEMMPYDALMSNKSCACALLFLPLVPVLLVTEQSSKGDASLASATMPNSSKKIVFIVSYKTVTTLVIVLVNVAM